MGDIENALTTFEYQDATPLQLATYIGFDEDELKMIDIFWDPTFNSGWIYLSDDLILNDLGYKQISHFYKDTLRILYKNNIDYKEVDITHKLISEFYKISNEDQSSLGLKPHTGGKTKKYYIMNGKAFKKLLMNTKTLKGEKIRDYYIKIEELAIFMKDYIMELHKHIHKKQLLLKDEIIKEKDSKILKIQSFINNVAQKDENEYIYIATTEQYAINNQFKIGTFLFFYLLNLKI